MPLVGAIVVALLTFAAMIRTSGTLYRSMELHSAPDDADIHSIDNFCRTLPLLATMLLIPLSSYRDFIIPRALALLWWVLCEIIQLGLWTVVLVIHGATDLWMLFLAAIDLFSIHPVHNEDAARSLRARVSAERASRAAMLTRYGEFPVEAWVANALSGEATLARALSNRLARATTALRSLLESKARCAEEIARSKQEEEVRRCARRLERANLMGRWFGSTVLDRPWLALHAGMLQGSPRGHETRARVAWMSRGEG